MSTEFIDAINDLVKEKHISKELLYEAIESALISAYKKEYGTMQNIRVDIDEKSGQINVLTRMDVVEEVDDEFTQVSLKDAKDIDPRYEVGDIIEYQVTPKDFGRIAAQAAKQVVVQRIRETERGMVYDSFVDRQGDVVTGKIERVNNDTVFINIGDTEGILSQKDQVKGEHYEVNQRLKVYISDVRKTNKGPQVFLSRRTAEFVKGLFALEVPEIADGTVEIKGIDREAGSRTKMAVYTEYENVDPVGACVGKRGDRVRPIVEELNGEKIDIIVWSEDPEELIANVLSPAKVEKVVILDEEARNAMAIVPDYQLSLAIGKGGQNARLAVKVSGWNIDIKSHSKYYGDEDFVDVEDEEDDDEHLFSEVADDLEEEIEREDD